MIGTGIIRAIVNRKPQIVNVNRHCHNCGEPWTLDGQPGRGETCMKCRADLRVCLNCSHFDPRAAQQCRERRAGPVLEKHAGNFCEFFEFARRDWKPKSRDNSREDAARERMRKLFGDPGDGADVGGGIDRKAKTLGGAL